MAFTAAKYHGICVVCSTMVVPGDMIGYDADGVTCEDCYERKPETAKPDKKPCPDCWTVHEGECL
ncbi:hypothetical protein SEA_TROGGLEHUMPER_5 [Rhodococcus phage Trogglehumper]|uniref:Uncharacterized protein n=1 Tax=Rhodococcus phage Trogglehumper TaxID=3038381 RepID=A0AAF0GJ07_9CAUD|nr:hypothetical protein SEA_TROGGLEHUMPER_5 [Rhodococcus phage Trogglehumper]